MNWQVEIERKALKNLKSIPAPYKLSITEAIDRLSDDPRPEADITHVIHIFKLNLL
jgi:mRNA-degrading endonuclease RelE of RelBE toxin-antitoxin system